MKTILVPTDFSKSADNAAIYAVNLAQKLKANILLYHVYNLPIETAPDVSAPFVTVDQLQLENERLLKKHVARLQKIAPVKIKYKAEFGLAVDEILEKEKQVSYIVMGMQGAEKLTEIIIGSITTAVLQKTKKPLLIIPEKRKYALPKKIVLATDYDPSVNVRSFDTLKTFIKKFNSDIFILNIRSKKEKVSKENAIAESNLESALKGERHFYYYPEKEDVIDGINDFVKSKQADMIAIIPHKYNFFNKLFHRSASKRMAFHTKVPLLALPDNHKSIDAELI